LSCSRTRMLVFVVMRGNKEESGIIRFELMMLFL
jgi:hypothetical protein